MSIWIVVALVLLAAVFLRWLGKRPATYKRIPLSGLSRFVASLPAQMAPGGFFIADRERGSGFLQVALREYGHLRCTLEFGLPELDWSAHRFSEVVASLQRAHFEPVVEPGRGGVSRFMRVLIAGPEAHVVERTMQLLQLVARELGWEQSTYRVRFGGSLALGRPLEKVRARGA